MNPHHLDRAAHAHRNEPSPVAAAPVAGTVSVACIPSDQLLRGGSEVLIDHHGALYRLRQTSLGKLILTK